MHALLLSLVLVVGGAISPLLGTALLATVVVLQFAIVGLRVSRNKPFSNRTQAVATTVFSQAVCLTTAGLALVLMIPLLSALPTTTGNRDGLSDQVLAVMLSVIVAHWYYYGTSTMQEMLSGSEWQYASPNSEESPARARNKLAS